jgi:adenylosuccinate synthase
MRAYKSILKKYEVWKKALDISWKEYLSEIAKNPFTGEWAKEVAEHLIKSGEEQGGT